MGQNGILQNPDKLQFCQKEVTWSGFAITATGVKPLPEHTEAIRSFPSPKNLTDIRSFYALCNQVAHYYAVRPELEPILALLKKGQKFYWDQTLETLFEDMKMKIAEEVKVGVKLFEESLPTALLTD